MIIRYNGDPATVRAAVEQKWKQIAPDVPFEAKFSEEIVGEPVQGRGLRARRSSPLSLCWPC